MYKVVVPVVIVLSLFLQSCSNSLFYYPSGGGKANADVQWLHSSSGNDIAYVWLPAKTGEPKGIVVHFHGNSGHIGETKEKVDWLVEHGYHVMVFDYSGFGFSSGAATDKALYADSKSVLKLTSRLKRDLGLPTFIIATSTGGNVFLRAWVEQPIDLDGVIIDSSFISYIEVTDHVLQQNFLGKLYSWISEILMRDQYAAKPVISQIPKAKTLVVHCEEDKIIPISFGYEIYTQLNGDKEFWQLSQCAHARGITRDFPDNQSRLVNWLESATPDFEVARMEPAGGVTPILNAF